MFDVVASAMAGMVLMHMRGDPKTMQADPHYDDVVAEVRGFLAGRLEAAVAAGIGRDRLCVDPGIGFGKNLEHNLALLRSIGSFRELGVPVLVGVSRKRFVGELSGADDPAEPVGGLRRGGRVVRVARGGDGAGPRRGGDGSCAPRRGCDRPGAAVTDDRPIVLLLHDRGRSAEQWREFVPLLESRFRVVAPDLPADDDRCCSSSWRRCSTASGAA